MNSNALIMKYADLINSEWDYEKNNAIGLKQDEVSKGSKKKAWWHCEAYGHSYEMTVYNKTTLHHNCPYCAGNKVLAGFNDFESQYPDLMGEWDWIENDKHGLKPDGITKASGIKANWL